MEAEVFSTGYHKRSRDKYAEIKSQREVALGDTKSFNDRVSSTEGKAKAVSKEYTSVRALQPPHATPLPVGSWKTAKKAK